jgi:hypothetical protein
MHGLVVLRMSGKLDDSPSFDVLRDAAVRMVMRGVRAGGRDDKVSVVVAISAD